MSTDQVSAKWLSKNVETVFSHTTAYHSHIPMAGRQRETEELAAVLRGEGPRLVFVKASLGAGKTFLLDRTLQRARNDAEYAQVADGIVVTQANVPGGPQPPVEGVPEPVWVVEELDRKPELHVLQTALHRAVEWLSEQESATLVLTGDRFLEHDLVAEVTGRVECERFWLSLDDLDVRLLNEAVERRIDVNLVAGTAENVDDIETTDAGRAAARRLLDDDIVTDGLIPGTTPEVGNFRDALSFLKNLAGQFHADDPCRLTADDLARYSDKATIPPRGLKLEAQQAVADEVVRRHQAGEPWAPLTVEEVIDLVPHRAGDPDEYEPEEYLLETLHPLVRSGMLEPLGVPHQDGIQYVGPFLPSPRLFIETYAGIVQARG